MTTARTRDHDIHELFFNRWSARAFEPQEIPDAALMRMFEAARFAPSRRNIQPWRFIYAKRGSPHWDTFLGFMAKHNSEWAMNASALVVVAALTVDPENGKPHLPHVATYSIDIGAAWAFLALQAFHMGWTTHGIIGFDKETARRVLQVPDIFKMEMMIVIGKRGDPATLSQFNRDQEFPSARKPVREIACEGQFQFD